MATPIKLKGVRARFPKLFEAEQFDGQGPFRRSCDFHVEPGSDLDKQIQQAIRDEAQAVWGKGWEKQLPGIMANNQKCSYTNGDNTKYESDDGMMILSAKRYEKDGPPLVYDRQKNLLTKDDGTIYSGCYVNASVEIWAQKGQYQGIRCTLMGVQFVKDGDNFGGAAKPKEDDFEELAAPEGEDELV